jgi:hypothetical protein
VRGSFRIPVHPPLATRPATLPQEGDEDRFVDRECFEFNQLLRPAWNDRRCEHCRHYLTARCPHIDEFLDDVEDLTPE